MKDIYRNIKSKRGDPKLPGTSETTRQLPGKDGAVTANSRGFRGNSVLLRISPAPFDHVQVLAADPKSSSVHNLGTSDRTSCCLSINSDLLGARPPSENYTTGQPNIVSIAERDISLPWQLRSNNRRSNRCRRSSSTPDGLEEYESFINKHKSLSLSPRSFSLSPMRSLSSDNVTLGSSKFNNRISQRPIMKCSVVLKKMKIKNNDAHAGNVTIKIEPVDEDTRSKIDEGPVRNELDEALFDETETTGERGSVDLMECGTTRGFPMDDISINDIEQQDVVTVENNRLKDWSEFELDFKERNRSETEQFENQTETEACLDQFEAGINQLLPLHDEVDNQTDESKAEVEIVVEDAMEDQCRIDEHKTLSTVVDEGKSNHLNFGKITTSLSELDLPEVIYCVSCQKSLVWKHVELYRHKILNVITCQVSRERERDRQTNRETEREREKDRERQRQRDRESESEITHIFYLEML